MKFSAAAISKAVHRQYDGKQLGVTCAKCGKYILDFYPGADCVAIPRIPIAEGGKTSDNCVIVCLKCSEEIGQDGTKTIPDIAIPYYSRRR